MRLKLRNTTLAGFRETVLTSRKKALTNKAVGAFTENASGDHIVGSAGCCNILSLNCLSSGVADGPLFKSDVEMAVPE